MKHDIAGATTSATASTATATAQRWLVALLFLGTALNYVDRQVLSLLKPTLSQEFGWNDQQFAHLGAAFQLTAAAALLVVGPLVDRLGVRRAYGGAVGIWSLAGAAHAFAATLTQFLGARVVLAAAEAVNTPAVVKACAQYLPLAQRSRALGIINSAPNLGAILTPLLIPAFALAFGWKAAFLVTGALGFIWLLAWFPATRALEKTLVTAPPLTTTASATGDDTQSTAAPWLTQSLFKDPTTWAIAGAKALTDMVWWFMLFWMPDFFVRSFGLSQGGVAGPVALIFACAALGALSSGFLFPWLVDRGLRPDRARKLSMLGYALLVLPLPLALQAGGPWTAALLIGLGLFAHQGFATNIFGLAADTVPVERIARVMAFGAICGNLTGMGIIEFTGWSLTSGVGYWPMFAVASSAYLLATGWVQLLVRSPVRT
jgi:ACS family hexuronate transporter-like MFS transporter